MGIFDGIRNMMTGSREIHAGWTEPETEEELKELLRDSSMPVVIYKHSFSCGVCVFAKSTLEELLDSYSGKAAFIFIDVIHSRALSNFVEAETGIRHESPQVLILNKGEVFWHASHGDIRQPILEETLEEIL